MLKLRNWIVGDQVHLADNSLEGFLKALDGFCGAGYVFDEDVLKSDLPFRRFEVFTAGRDQFVEWIFAVDRHQKITRRIIIAVQRNG